MLLISLVLHIAVESTSAHVVIGHFCENGMVCGGALNPTELCFIFRCAGLWLEIVILILCWYETRNSCVKISLPCESCDGCKCDRFKVTEAIMS